jgi:hypothetical protein
MFQEVIFRQFDITRASQILLITLFFKPHNLSVNEARNIWPKKQVQGYEKAE